VKKPAKRSDMIFYIVAAAIALAFIILAVTGKIQPSS
jgi:hypothetical protein